MFGFSKGKVIQNQKFIGIIIQHNKFYLVVVEFSNDNALEIVHEYHDEFYNHNDLKKKLSSYVLKHDLSQVKCNWILNPKEYKLLVFDIPPIPEEEQLQALKWQVLEKTDYEEEDILIDFMDIPTNSASSNPGKIFSVIVNKKQIIEMASILESAQLNLCTIDIAENALINLLSGTKFRNENIAFIIKIFGKLTLLVCNNNRLYLTRKLSLSWVDDSESETTSNAERKSIAKDMPEASNIKLAISDDSPIEPMHQLSITKGAVKDLKDLEFEEETDIETDNTAPDVIKLLADEVKRSFEYCTNSLYIDEPGKILYTNVGEINKFEKKFSELISKDVKKISVGDSWGDYIENENINLVALGGALRYQNEK